MSFRVLISGPQDFADDLLLKQKCNEMLCNKQEVEVCAPTLRGTAALAIKYSKISNHKLKVYKVDWAGWGNKSIEETYKEMLEYVDAAIIFHNGDEFSTGNLIKLCKERPLPHRIFYYKSIKKQIEEAEELLPKEKKSRKPIPLTPEQRDRYKAAHKQWQETSTPVAVADHGYVDTKMVPINSASRLQGFAENFFNWSGHHLERQANMGVMRNGKWTTGSGTKGATDNHGHFVSKNHPFPLPIYLEFKFGKDSMREAQVKYQKKITSTGALHAVIKTPADVFEFYDYLSSL